MGSRGSVSITRGGKPKKKSKFSAQEKVERARVGAFQRRRDATTRRRGGSIVRSIRAKYAKADVAQVRRRYKRNPLPRANRNPRTAPGGGAPRRQRG